MSRGDALIESLDRFYPGSSSEEESSSSSEEEEEEYEDDEYYDDDYSYSDESSEEKSREVKNVNFATAEEEREVAYSDEVERAARKERGNCCLHYSNL